MGEDTTVCVSTNVPPLCCRNWRSFCLAWRRITLRSVDAKMWINVAECDWSVSYGLTGKQMNQSVDLNSNMTSARSPTWLSAAVVLGAFFFYLTFINTEVNMCLAHYWSNILKYYVMMCCKMHWNTVILAYKNVNLHLEHYTLFHSATQKTNVWLLDCTWKWMTGELDSQKWAQSIFVAP